MSRLAVSLAVAALLAASFAAALLLSPESSETVLSGTAGTDRLPPECRPAQDPVLGQTPTTSQGELLGLRAELITEGLVDPVDVMQLPGWDLLLVAEKPGRIVAVRDGVILDKPVLDISDRVSSDINERGLLTIEADPHFENSCRLFLFFTDLDGDSNLVSARVTGTYMPTIDPASMRTLLVVPQRQRYHQSGSMVFGPDGELWVSIGDGGLGQQRNAQDPQTLEGSVIHLDVVSGPYVAPGQNAFGVELDIPEIWAIGLRNPWRITIDHETGTVYVPDTGFETTEEINIAPIARAGLNFGWPVTEGEVCSQQADCDTSPFALPTYSYPRGGGHCAVIGGVVYRGDAIPELQGHYFFGDFCSGDIRSLYYQSGVVTDFTEWKPELDMGATMTSFGTDSAGEMYVTALSGKLWKIVPRRS